MKLKLKNLNYLLFALFCISLIVLKICNPENITKINSCEMNKNIGKFVKMCGTIVKLKKYNTIEIIYFKDECGTFKAVIFPSHFQLFKNLESEKSYCVCGEITPYKGSLELQIKDLC